MLLLTVIGPELTMEVRAAFYSTGAEAVQPPGANSSTQPRPLACAPSEEAARRNPRGGLGISPRAAVGVLAEATNKLATVYLSTFCRKGCTRVPSYAGRRWGRSRATSVLLVALPKSWLG